MSIQAILLPVFAQAALVFVAFGVLVLARQRAFSRGAVQPQRIALGEDLWPDDAKRANAAYGNLFEMPVLFFAIVPIAILTRTADVVFVVLAWLFVISRAVQLAIHLTRNVVILRGSAFFAGSITLLLIWVIVAVRVLLAPFFLTL